MVNKGPSGLQSIPLERRVFWRILHYYGLAIPGVISRTVSRFLWFGCGSVTAVALCYLLGLAGEPAEPVLVARQPVVVPRPIQPVAVPVRRARRGAGEVTVVAVDERRVPGTSVVPVEARAAVRRSSKGPTLKLAEKSSAAGASRGPGPRLPRKPSRKVAARPGRSPQKDGGLNEAEGEVRDGELKALFDRWAALPSAADPAAARFQLIQDAEGLSDRRAGEEKWAIRRCLTEARMIAADDERANTKVHRCLRTLERALR